MAKKKEKRKRCDADGLIGKAVAAAEAMGLVRPGDVTIISAGAPAGIFGTTNFVKARIADKVLLRGCGIHL